MPRLTASYEKVYGKSEVSSQSSIKIRKTIRLVKADGTLKGERCKECSGFAFQFGKGIRPILQKEFTHKKGCSLG